MKFFQQSWPVWAVVFLYAGAALKFSLATVGDEQPVPEWVWWSVNAAFTATTLVAIQTLMIIRRLDERQGGSSPTAESEDVS